MNQKLSEMGFMMVIATTFLAAISPDGFIKYITMGMFLVSCGVMLYGVFATAKPDPVMVALDELEKDIVKYKQDQVDTKSEGEVK